MPLSAGTCLGPYEILSALGTGGMGEVYKARDPQTSRLVALKVLPAHLDDDPEHAGRFEREARALAALNHPNIVTLYSIERAGNVRFLAMELVEGKTLAQLIPVGGMPLGSLLALAIPMADALDCAHRHRIVHRDLKPANVMVNSEGRVKVLDFGLARFDTGPDVAGDESTIAPMTRAGQIFGTCAYMSPEQTTGRPVDARSDIFSLGTVLFEMGTGRRPFQGENAIDVLIAVRQETPPSVCELRPTLPEGFGRLIEQCLEKEPERRVLTARDVCSDLDVIRKAADSGVSVTSSSVTTSPRLRDRRVAVLPFANMSADPEQEYFCDGVAEDLINVLANIEGLQVAARTSAFAFKGQNRDVREIGRLLDVGAVLEGSVRRAGNQLRISAQLIRVRDGMHLWSERFDRTLDDVFAIQDEISLSIVDRLKVQLLADEEARVVRRHTVDPEAHSLYLKGRYLFARRSEGDVKRAIPCYEQAIARDADYALPRVGIADALLVLAQWGWLPANDALVRAKAELERALELDPALAEAHASLGGVACGLEWEWDLAERSLARAITLNPRYAFAHHVYALLLCIRERFDEAVRQSRIYLGFEPLSPAANTHLGQVLFHAGRQAEAIEQFHKALELEPRISPAYFWLSLAYLSVGRADLALEASEACLRLCGPAAPTCLAIALAALGRHDEARQRIEEASEQPDGRKPSPFMRAFSSAALGEHDVAVAQLGRAFEERDPKLSFIRILGMHAWWDPVLADSRVRALMWKMNLPGNSDERPGTTV
jgi:eukaryotic-like serine/threonine-protein kinase